MTDIATRSNPVAGAWSGTIMRNIVDARDRVADAKRSHSTEALEDAQGTLQAAVDAARAQHVQWGEIGAVLGIARGNAYQRYRRRPPRDPRTGQTKNDRDRTGY